MLNIITDKMLKNYTTYKIGGLADFFVEVTTTSEMEEALSYAWDNDIYFRVLGKGSNVLISDKGFRGLIIYNNCQNLEIHEKQHSISILADSGVVLSQLAILTAQRGLQGLEWAVGIPGTIGGGLLTNAGAVGGDIAACLDYITVFSKTEGEKKRFVDELELGYRTSIYRTNTRLIEEEAILSVQVILEKGDITKTTETVNRHIESRKKREPVEPNVGSIFKNPSGYSVRKLVKECNLHGRRIGGARIPEIAPSFIINEHNATSKDVLSLIFLIKTTIFEKYGILLELEVELIGEWEESLKEMINFVLQRGY